MNKLKIKKVGQQVIKLESIALAKLSKSLDEDFIKAVELISQQSGKIIISGIDRMVTFKDFIFKFYYYIFE